MNNKQFCVDNELTYQVYRANLLRSLSNLNFTEWFNISSPPSLPQKEGILVFLDESTGNKIPAYSNDIQRRFEELLEEDRMKDSTRFCYTFIEGTEQRKKFRYELKLMQEFENLDNEGIIPEMV
ncbi:hypothetical protein [Paenibacillus dauci]|uniref:hypothetical protein n=1 Tax=Paenibacillus dauci TaxID=1567106 RepID=UPI0006195F2D|nr:hypothetical protein [Paenibacillus dauci]